MKKLLYHTFIFAALAIGFTSCNDDEDPDNGVTITGVPPTASIEAGGTLGPVTATATAPDGLAQLVITKDGATFATIPLTGTTASAPFSYTALPEDAGKSVVFTFTVTDVDGDEAVATHVLTVGAEETVINVTSNITSDVTWETGKVYILQGRISVEAGATLTIQPGVIVKGSAGSGANASALVVARDATINAVGEVNNPIIFTSFADQIQPGQIISPNLTPDINGLWGGVLILGNATCSLGGDVTETQIEGIPPSDTNGLYGGNDDDDNSGMFKYVSIRHGGANIGEGNEINGLTLGGVGRETEIEFVEVVGNQDDGIEWFGGTVNVTNAVVWNAGDDAMDTDQSWAGTLDNFAVIAGSETDHALEIDGPEGSYLAGHTLRNGSVKGDGANTELGDFRDGARGSFDGIYFFNFPSPNELDDDMEKIGRGDFSLSGDESNENFANGVLVFSMLETTLPTSVMTMLSEVFKNGTDVHASDVATPLSGADVSVFAGWSWTSEAGELSDF